MLKLSDERKTTLIQAQSAGEVAGLLRDAGGDEALAERVWAELTHWRRTDGKELSPDELEAVSGGVTDRDWFSEGCAATVREGSDCWGTDGGCSLININYIGMPNCECSICGSRAYSYWEDNWEKSTHILYEKCRHCGNTHRAKMPYESY